MARRSAAAAAASGRARMEGVAEADERAEGGKRARCCGGHRGACRAVSTTAGHAAAGLCRGATASRADARACGGAGGERRRRGPGHQRSWAESEAGAQQRKSDFFSFSKYFPDFKSLFEIQIWG
jgi:hypothetical protein